MERDLRQKQDLKVYKLNFCPKINLKLTAFHMYNQMRIYLEYSWNLIAWLFLLLFRMQNKYNRQQ